MQLIERNKNAIRAINIAKQTKQGKMMETLLTRVQDLLKDNIKELETPIGEIMGEK